MKEPGSYLGQEALLSYTPNPHKTGKCVSNELWWQMPYGLLVGIKHKYYSLMEQFREWQYIAKLGWLSKMLYFILPRHFPSNSASNSTILFKALQFCNPSSK